MRETVRETRKIATGKPRKVGKVSAIAGQAATGDRIADELVEAIELGIDVDEYCAARGAGATHAEALERARR